MSLPTTLYIIGMAGLFVGQRLLDGIDPWSSIISTISLAVVAVSLWLRVRAGKQSTDSGTKSAHRLTLRFMVLGIVALIVYALTTESVTSAIKLTDEGLRRWQGVFSSLWPVLWTLAIVPHIALDRAIQASPKRLQPQRTRQTIQQGVQAALVVCIVFPLNFLAAHHNKTWDLAYFKTSQAGSATQSVVQALEQPIDVQVFLPPASDVRPELENFFGQLKSPNLNVQFVDFAAEPKLSKSLGVRDNGIIAFSLPTKSDAETSESSDPNDDGHGHGASGGKSTAARTAKTLRIGTELSKAKSKLKKLDQDVQKILLELGQGQRTVYLTRGHGELDLRESKDPKRKISGLKQIFELMNLEVKSLSVDGGLAEGVPEDANLVMVLGPVHNFLESEVAALRAFIDRGGAVLVALEPTGETGATQPSIGKQHLDDFVAHLGLKLGEGMIVSQQGIIPVYRNKRDRLNVATDRFSTHSSTAVLSRTSPLLFLFTPTAGHLETLGEAKSSVTTTVRSTASSWADLNGNLEFDADANEIKKTRNLVAVATGSNGENKWKAIVTADADMFSDFALANRGNQQLVYDGLNWLLGTEAHSGTLESEEDVRIQHTREGQAIWFYLTVLVIPLTLLGLGAAFVSRRNRGIA